MNWMKIYLFLVPKILVDIKVPGTACVNVNALHGRRGPPLGGANAAMY